MHAYLWMFIPPNMIGMHPSPCTNFHGVLRNGVAQVIWSPGMNDPQLNLESAKGGGTR